MKQIVILLTASVVCLFYKPVNAQEDKTSFATSLIVASQSNQAEGPSHFISVKAALIKNKVVLQWSVNENEKASQFEIEKSTDGKNFSMAALVFGTDKPATDDYQFYEKATTKKVLYRIKLISNDQKTEYSTVIKIGAAK